MGKKAKARRQAKEAAALQEQLEIMARFQKALREGKKLNPAMVNQAIRRHEALTRRAAGTEKKEP